MAQETILLPKFKAALFDLDGVVLDTESQYFTFWSAIGREFHPEVEDFGNLIKGQTLVQIYNRWFAGQPDIQTHITARLNTFEQEMTFPYIAGVLPFVLQLRQKGITTAIVTSSNMPKMQQAYRSHPELRELFDCILTSEDFAASKPAPDCYLLGASRCGAAPTECVVFEDSINGLRAGRGSGAFVVGLATTNPRETIEPLADMVITDFEDDSLKIID